MRVEMPDEIKERLTVFLADAHAMEEQSVRELRAALEGARWSGLIRVLREHLGATGEHEARVWRLMEERTARLPREPVRERAWTSWPDPFGVAGGASSRRALSRLLSFEALEYATYDLLARMAERARETSVAEVVREIRDEERTMTSRLEELLDRTVEESLRHAGPAGPRVALRADLAEIRALEIQSFQLLESGREMMETVGLGRLFDEHRSETLRHRELVEGRLARAGHGPAGLAEPGIGVEGEPGLEAYVRRPPECPGMLVAFAYAFEHLEIGAYEQLRGVAERADDPETAVLAAAIVAEERRAAERFAGAFGEAVSAVIAP